MVGAVRGIIIDPEDFRWTSFGRWSLSPPSSTSEEVLEVDREKGGVGREVVPCSVFRMVGIVEED